MCGVELLLFCCAAGTAGGCCACRKKRQKDGKKDKNKPEKGVKGGHETYSKGNRTRKENSPPKPRNHTKPRHAKSRQKEEKGKDALDKQGKKKDESLHLQRPRLTAYEEYTQGVQVLRPSADLQKRSKSSTPAKRGVMDEEELNRLKKYQSKEKLKSFW